MPTVIKIPPKIIRALICFNSSIYLEASLFLSGTDAVDKPLNIITNYNKTPLQLEGVASCENNASPQSYARSEQSIGTKDIEPD